MQFTTTTKITVLATVLAALGCQKQATTPPVTEAPTPTPAATKEKAASDRQAQEAAAKRAQLAALPALPGIEAARAVTFPEPQIQTLPNGLELVVLEDHEVPKLRVSAFVKAGNIYAPGDQPSLAEFTLLLLGEGTKKRDKATFDAQVDATGGDMIAAIDDEVAGVTADVLARDASFAFAAVAEQVMQPALPETSLKKIKDRAAAGGRRAEGLALRPVVAHGGARDLRGGEPVRPAVPDHRADRGLDPRAGARVPREALFAGQYDAGGGRRHHAEAGAAARRQGLWDMARGTGGVGAEGQAPGPRGWLGGVHRRPQGQRAGLGARAGGRAGHR